MSRYMELVSMPSLTARRLDPTQAPGPNDAEHSGQNHKQDDVATSAERPERRQSPRTPVDKILCLQLDAENHAIVLNISDEGLAFHAVNPVMAASEIEFTLSLPNNHRIHATGELAWVDETGKTGGLRFTSLPDGAREQLRDWAQQCAAGTSLLTPAEEPEPDPLPVPVQSAPEPPPAPERPLPPRRYTIAARPVATPRGYTVSTPATSEALPAASPAPPHWPRPQHSSPLLSGDADSNSQSYNSNDRSNSSFQNRSDEQPPAAERPTFFRGFLTGALVAVVAAALFLFADGHQVADYLTHLRGAAEAELMPQNAQPQNAQPQSALAQAAAPSIASTPASAPDLAAPPAIPSARGTQTQTPAATPDAAPPVRPRNQPAQPQAAVPSAPASAPRALRDSKRITERPASPRNPATIDSVNGKAAQASEDSGESELAIAQSYLSKHGGAADDAARAYLWSAVEKGSVAAELKLADLYARGDGVPRSCDQARVLLDAAASRGSSEADQQLAQIARAGCN